MLIFLYTVFLVYIHNFVLYVLEIKICFLYFLHFDFSIPEKIVIITRYGIQSHENIHLEC